MTELSPTARSCGLAGPSVGRSRSSRSGTLACCVTGPWRHWPSAVRAVGCRSFSLPFPDLSLYCHCLATALSLPLPFPDLSLFCHCLITALPLPCHCLLTAFHCIVTALPLPCHCLLTAFSLPFPDLSLHFHCIFTALPLPCHCHCLSLTFHCIVTALRLPCHCRSLSSTFLSFDSFDSSTFYLGSAILRLPDLFRQIDLNDGHSIYK